MASDSLIIPRYETARPVVSGRPGPDADGCNSLSSSGCPADGPTSVELETKSFPGSPCGSSKSPDKALLGKNTILASHEGKQEKKSDSDQKKQALKSRYALQNGACHLLPEQRVAGCHRWRSFGHDGVEVWHIPETMTARLGGLQVCGSVWACPVCATKISERRKVELAAALSSAHEKGWEVLMVTYTLRHYASDTLADLIEGLTKARRMATSGRAAKQLREDCGVVGSVRALEVTRGENGWHPHIHELVFVRSDREVGRLLAGLRVQWENGLRLAGLREVNEHGVDFAIADSNVAGYVAKFGHERGWNVEHELTKQVTKKGRAGGRTPTDLLAAFKFDGDLQAGEWWREYARVMKGGVQLRWSKGLRSSLGLAVEKSDEELAAGVEKSGVLLGLLSDNEWRLILADDARAELLAVASTGDRAAFERFRAAYREGVSIRRFQPLRRCGAGREGLEEEAAAAGLTFTEYRAWLRGGMNAFAVPVMPGGAAQRGPRHRRGREGGNKKCQEQE